MTGANIQLQSAPMPQPQVNTQQSLPTGGKSEQSFAKALQKAAASPSDTTKASAPSQKSVPTEQTQQAPQTDSVTEKAGASLQEDLSEAMVYMKTVVQDVQAYASEMTVESSKVPTVTDMLSSIMQLLAQFESAKRTETSKEAAEMAASLMIALLAPTEDMTKAQLQAIMTGDVAAISGLAELPNNSLQAFQSFFGTQIQAQANTLSDSVAKMAELLLGGSSKESAQSVQTIISSIRVTMTQTTIQSENPLALSGSFQNAVAMAAQKLQIARVENGKPTLIETDIALLQSQVDTGAFLNGLNAFRLETATGTQTLLPQTDVGFIAAQIKDYVAVNLQEAKNTLDMTLNPASLGKITIKLVEEGGRMTLSIMAANAQTQRLLTSQLTELRTAMAPYDVEIAQQNVTATEPAQQEQAQQWAQQHHQQGQQQQQNSQQQEQSSTEELEGFQRILAGFGGARLTQL